MKNVFTVHNRPQYVSRGNVRLQFSPVRINQSWVAEIPVDTQEYELPTVRVWQVRGRTESDLSYMMVCQRRAMVIDPVADMTVYQELARTQQAHIMHVLETHEGSRTPAIGRRLAAAEGAIYLSAADIQQFLKRTEGWPEFVLHAGQLPVHVLATPGHTPESVSYLIANVIFTGDLFSATGVQRPGEWQSRYKQALLLWQSISHLLDHLPDTTLVLPGQAPADQSPADGPVMMELGALHEQLKPELSNQAFFVEDRAAEQR